MTDATDDLEREHYRVGGVIDRVDFFWTTKNGKRLNVRDMETFHIQNCIHMLEKTIANRPDEYAWGEPDGDAAQEAFNSEIRHNEILEESYRYAIKQLNKELKRRQQ